MSRHAALVRNPGLPLLWLVFGPITAIAGRHPGYVRDRSAVPYPLAGVVATWAVLGVEALVFAWILGRPKGLRIALGLALVLLAGSLMLFATDMPDYEYVPLRWHFVLVVLFSIARFFEASSRNPGTKREGTTQ